MNMFKRGRKAKDQAQDDMWDAIARDDSPPRIFKSTKTLRRKKKTAEDEDKPTLDLGNALPATGDFRTSLLMPGLSARFSMLREQDDPNTMIGKASDDSVLFPKRASRLNLFGHGNVLGDIAEVESIRSSFRPPFADRDRSNSFTGDGYDSDNGSMLSRSRPGEGNVLFGGRQKLYRIPTGSNRALNEADASTLDAKHMYEHDVALSLFQQYRMKTRERRDSLEENRDSQTMEPDEMNSVQTPSTAFSKNRGTHSSTNSGRSNLRVSTAATSVASESPAPRYSGGPLNGIASKLGIDRPNTSADSFHHLATSPGLRKVCDDDFQPVRQLSPSKSAANLRDRSQRSGAIFAASPFRAMSPLLPASVAQPLDFGFDNKENVPTSPIKLIESPMVQSDEFLAKNVQPNDRGKATALGLFNKPAKEFDEQQYSQRQLQMHEGRNSPFSTTSRSGSAASNDARPGPQHDTLARASPIPIDRTSTPQVPPIPSQPVSPISTSQRASRTSNISGGRGTPPRPRSKSSASATVKDNVKARVESLIRRQNAELAAMEAEKMAELSHQKSNASASKKETSHGTFYDGSDSDQDEQSQETNLGALNTAHLPDGDIHPAFRSEVTQTRRSDNSNFSKPLSIVEDDHVIINGSSIPTIEENGQAGLGLSGLIRTHLRHDSGKSSFVRPCSSEILDVTSDRTPQDSVQSLANVDTNGTSNSSYNSVTNQHLSVVNTPAHCPPSPHTVMSQKAHRMLEQAMNLRNAVNCRIEGDQEDMPIESSTEHTSGQDDKEPLHRRGESSETTKERREFDEELAERRRRIQEGLRSVTERERSTSPAVLRGRDLRMEAFAQPQGSSGRGGDARPIIESRTSDEQRGRKSSAHHDRRGPTPDYFSNSGQPSARSRQDGVDRFTQSRSNTPNSARPSQGDRPNSGPENRSKSRTRQAHDFRPSMPGSFPSQPSSPMPSQGEGSSESHSVLRSVSAMSSRMGHRATSSPSPNLSINHGSRGSPRPSPISPVSSYIQSQQSGHSSGRNTPTSNNWAIPLGGRRRAGTKTPISDPTFISSTSSVALVPLPSPQAQTAPPLPEMNPRRRGNTLEKLHPVLMFNNSARSPLATVPASPRLVDAEFQEAMNDPASLPRNRPRLRKSSSEGGNLATKARQQAVMAEIAHEKSNSPAVPVFPNRSATSLGINNQNNMF